MDKIRTSVTIVTWEASRRHRYTRSSSRGTLTNVSMRDQASGKRSRMSYAKRKVREATDVWETSWRGVVSKRRGFLLGSWFLIRLKRIYCITPTLTFGVLCLRFLCKLRERITGMPLQSSQFSMRFVRFCLPRIWSIRSAMGNRAILIPTDAAGYADQTRKTLCTSFASKSAQKWSTTKWEV